MQSCPDQKVSLLEVRNRKGTAMLRAVGTTAIVAAVAIYVIRCVIRLTAIVLLAQLGGPWLP